MFFFIPFCIILAKFIKETFLIFFTSPNFFFVLSDYFFFLILLIINTNIVQDMYECWWQMRYPPSYGYAPARISYSGYASPSYGYASMYEMLYLAHDSSRPPST